MRGRHISVFLTLVVVLLASCASNPNRQPGSSLSRINGIVAFQVNLLADQPAAVTVKLTSSRQYFGPAQVFGFRSEDRFIFRDMIEGTYSWSELETTVSGASRVNMRGSLPDFTVRPGCINYIGEITIDLRGGNVLVNQTTVGHVQALAKLRELYPAEISKYGTCR